MYHLFHHLINIANSVFPSFNFFSRTTQCPFKKIKSILLATLKLIKKHIIVMYFCLLCIKTGAFV